MTNKNLIDLEAMSVQQIDKLVKKAKKIMQSPADYRHACDGKILATLFYEPSTRTQMSFQTAMLKLGGRTIGFDNPMNSSVSKGENLKDTIAVISGYSDIIAIRHPTEGTAMAASLYSEVPVINCGDGGHLHPTQTLTDIVTLSCEKGRLDHLKIGVCGDLLNGRTVHSLIKALSKYEGNSFVLISTPELSVPIYIIDILEKNHCAYEISHNLADAVRDLDMLYMTRIQRERFGSEEEYQAQKNVFVLDKEKLDNAREDMIILHPLPRVNEITVEIDDDPRALYFKQAQYGMFGRMALILLLLQDEEFMLSARDTFISDYRCNNPKCITQSEKYLPRLSYEKLGMQMCDFCDKRID
ncbi:aspartate carbamoyltransferase [Lachnoclostridium sp. MSJ-17]|uniref:aspartate carbamoyltransferase n=1 Tax=Lachnoclostridium sp. MSJ-17 TaxID=2841516 RepID=UPI001C0FF818|nr:aspartate carbamoyltransferase [Lachnoclostridium sp. MSJ-17]MBU5461215.1 aspartate carbamoyltransferase [Lachnoclostridium sp. MSJ-17]